jgi:ParB family transcriptional regulator, chromosome partitioning protein
MSTKRGRWISRRGQAGADAAIDQVIDRQPQSGEQVQQVADELIADSPYQARQPFNDDNVEDLAQGMRAAGFQGVLIIRPHSEPKKRRVGMFQLVYGHRRRAAWRRVCMERGEPCVLPVIVRSVSDEQMLMIGAQENLQRQDLDPVEEAQLVAWHERMFADKNQAEIGAMLGKSSDWVSTRSRIHRLPDALKQRLRQRPRAISQMLELGVLDVHQPDAALELADRVVNENLTLDALRGLIRGYARPERRESTPEPTNRRGAATSVQDITSNASHPSASSGVREEENNRRGTATQVPSDAMTSVARSGRGTAALVGQSMVDNPTETADLLALEQVATTLASIASRAEQLPRSTMTLQLIDQAERALTQIRQTLTERHGQ